MVCTQVNITIDRVALLLCRCNSFCALYIIIVIFINRRFTLQLCRCIFLKRRISLQLYRCIVVIVYLLPGGLLFSCIVVNVYLLTGGLLYSCVELVTNLFHRLLSHHHGNDSCVFD